MSKNFGIPLKKYRLLSDLLNQDKEKYTDYGTDQKPQGVVFDDLVRTLKINPDLYQRPIVELEDYGYMVKGNNIFFTAGLKAGLKTFMCDINIRTFDDRHTSQFLVIDPIEKEPEFLVHKIFFVEPPMKNNNKGATIDKLNQFLKDKGFDDSVFFVSRECDDIIELKITHSFNSENLQETFTVSKQIIADLFSVRSINGLVE